MRHHIRYKWWVDPQHSSYKDISVLPVDVPDEPADPSLFADASYYTEGERPVFFGHYWLKGTPELYRSNVCCLDYSVAKGGALVAYRFDEEAVLGNERFVVV